jgi:hypothetical protein
LPRGGLHDALDLGRKLLQVCAKGVLGESTCRKDFMSPSIASQFQSMTNLGTNGLDQLLDGHFVDNPLRIDIFNHATSKPRFCSSKGNG